MGKGNWWINASDISGRQPVCFSEVECYIVKPPLFITPTFTIISPKELFLEFFFFLITIPHEIIPEISFQINCLYPSSFLRLCFQGPKLREKVQNLIWNPNGGNMHRLPSAARESQLCLPIINNTSWVLAGPTRIKVSLSLVPLVTIQLP